MNRYSICSVCDEEIFEKQCSALEKHIPDLKEVQTHTDVDGSKIKEYILNNKKISVHNSVYLNEVYIQSEVDLDEIFK